MKLTFIVYNDHFTPRVMQLLAEAGIDYYTRWEHTVGKGRGTEPHLGSGAFGSTNAVLMIAFEEEAPLEALIGGITAANQAIKRPADRIRLFQLPLERML